VIEVVGVRILSPYYGNTIYSVSSVISVILAALSLGYYIGGYLADRYPSLKWFYGIILASGLGVLLLQLSVYFFLPLIGYSLSFTTGPLISSLILFFVPSFLLGTLSPYAIKLQKTITPEIGIGRLSGEIFFWSTLGSIFGSLFTGFFLIPSFGINQIVFGVGILLILISTIAILSMRIEKNTMSKVVVLLAISLGAIFVLPLFRTKETIVYGRDGLYEKILIYDGLFEGRPTRFFQQDRSYSGAMFLESDELVYDYTKYYALYRVFKQDIKDVLVIGGGAYSIPKAILSELPYTNVNVSEIEPLLFDLAKKYFRVPEDKRLINFVEDGRHLLHDNEKKYDMIFSDVYYSLFSIPSHFTTVEFFQIAKNRLNSDGIFVANLIGTLSQKSPSLILSEIRTFQEVFPNSYFFAVDSPNYPGIQNIIFVGYNSDKKIDFNSSLIKDSQYELIRSLGKKLIDLTQFDLYSYPLMTDNYSPTEFMTSKLLKEENFQKVPLVQGDKILSLINKQLQYGPRFQSAPGHEEIKIFLISETNNLSHKTKIQEWEHASNDGPRETLTNIIGSFYPEKQERIIIGTHYDSKKFAENEEEKKDSPVPGANDSASGTAILLEIARYFAISKQEPRVGIDIVFFDGEEGEENLLDNSQWKPLGSTYFSEHLNEVYGEKKPASGLIIDMVCDKNLNISKEKSSVENAGKQVELFWEIAKKYYPNNFNSQIDYMILDDHTPLNRVGIPTFLVIDFDYPYFHTTEDTIDKCSAESLEVVANSVLNYIYAL